MGEQHVQESVDGSVVIYDPERGESKMIAPSAYTGILSIGEVVSAEDFEAEIQREGESYIQSQIAAARGDVRKFNIEVQSVDSYNLNNLSQTERRQDIQRTYISGSKSSAGQIQQVHPSWHEI
ncbi:MAG: hypothetical protein SPL53_04215 [Bacteroidales bacterium]|nr:hypothetical protein [Bacteroidales bacterium]